MSTTRGRPTGAAPSRPSGWFLTCVGAFRIIAPQFSSFVAGAIVANGGFFVGAGIVLLAVGGFITFKGYMA